MIKNKNFLDAFKFKEISDVIYAETIPANDFQKLNVNTYKIASCDITNYLLLEAVAKTKKPIFLSTGAADLNEIEEAVNFISKYNKKIVIRIDPRYYRPTEVDLLIGEVYNPNHSQFSMLCL